MASRAAANKAPGWMAPLKKWVYNMSGWNQYGLHHDDVLHEYEDVEEAIRRLPESVQMERAFRIIRASQLYLSNEVLPKDQWTKYEEDNRYLQPYLEQVRKEFAERDEWNKTH